MLSTRLGPIAPGARLVVALLAVAFAGGGAAGSAATAPAPQGTLVFVSDRAGSPQIYSIHADGSRLGQLTRKAVSTDLPPLFSPDGKRIVFARSRTLQVMDANGSGDRLLTSGFGHGVPAWSPDSRRLALTAGDDTGPLLVVGLAGESPRRVLGGSNGNPTWSPDGKRIAVNHAANSSARHDLVIVAAGGLGAQVIAKNADLPAWSPRGDLISFVRANVPGLFVVHPNGKGLRYVSKLDARYTAWSPDGTRIAARTDGGLFVVTVASRRARRILQGSFADRAPVWSPAGRWVAAQSGNDIVAAAAGGPPTRRVVVGNGSSVGFHNEAPGWRPRGSTDGRLGAKPQPISKPSPPITLITSGEVIGLAADGGRVAVAVDWSKKHCAHASVWKPGERLIPIGKQGPCPMPGTNDSPYWTSDLGLAGERLAWITWFPSSSTSYSYVNYASTADPARVTESTLGWDNLEIGVGDVHGAGNLLVLNEWQACPEGSEGSYECGPGGGDPLHDPTLEGEVLLRIGPKGPVEVRKGAGAFEVMDVDGGRIVVLEPKGAIRVLRANGSILHRLALPPRVALSAQLGGTQLAVFTRTQVQVYDAATGAAKGSVPIPAYRPASVDLDQGVATFVSRRTVHVVRLADGHQTSFSRRHGTVRAQIQPDGLFISYSVATGTRRGRVDFISRAQLERRLG